MSQSNSQVKLIFNVCSDQIPCSRFGRKPVLLGAIAVMSVSTILQIFAVSWTMFSILFFINGVGRVSSYVSAFVLGKYEHCMLLLKKKYYHLKLSLDMYISATFFFFFLPSLFVKVLRSSWAKCESCSRLWPYVWASPLATCCCLSWPTLYGTGNLCC